MSAYFIYTCFCFWLIFAYEINAISMNYSIQTRWNSYPITDHPPIQFILTSTEDQKYLLLEIDAPFFNNTPPPVEPGPYDKLYNYEVAEIFFLNSTTDHYIEMEFGPHGHYFILLFKIPRQPFKQLLPLPDYTVEFPAPNRWIGRVHIPRCLFPSHINRFNAYGIHGEQDNRIYEALFPAPRDSPYPDFHRLEYFQSINFDALLNVGDKDGDCWNSN